jgi:small subunit ribosomal protein S20
VRSKQPSPDEDPVANIKSQIKRNRQNERRRVRNKAVRSELKTRTKRAVEAAEQGGDDLEQHLRLAVQRLDKAAQKGVIHKNTAARRKSRLMRHIARLQEADAG